MAEFALVGPGDVISASASNVDPSVKTRAGWRWLPVEVTDVTYDPAAEVREGPVVTVLSSKVTRVWTRRAKTAAELDADKDVALNGTDMILFKILFGHENRIRALEGKAAITAAQFRAAVKASL